MIITEIETPIFPGKDLKKGRSPGLHVSDIYRALERELDEKKKAWPGGVSLYAETGFLFEEALEVAFRQRTGTDYRVGEIIKDGVIMSPDGVNVAAWELEEYKCTWTSSNKPIGSRWAWLTQIKSYLYGLDMCVCLLRVLYICGNYRDIRGPQYMEYRLEFDPVELETNWKMLIDYAHSREML